MNIKCKNWKQHVGQERTKKNHDLILSFCMCHVLSATKNDRWYMGTMYCIVLSWLLSCTVQTIFLPGPSDICRQNHCNSLLVPHLSGPGHQCQHLQPELSLEAGGCCAAAAPGGASWWLGLPHREASQEHYLNDSPCSDCPPANGAINSNTVV